MTVVSCSLLYTGLTRRLGPAAIESVMCTTTKQGCLSSVISDGVLFFHSQTKIHLAVKIQLPK
jgi:hypothetical protein